MATLTVTVDDLRKDKRNLTRDKEQLQRSVDQLLAQLSGHATIMKGPRRASTRSLPSNASHTLRVSRDSHHADDENDEEGYDYEEYDASVCSHAAFRGGDGNDNEHHGAP